MKRIISVMLSVIISFSLAVPAFAADSTQAEKKSPLTCLFSLYTGAQAERISDRIAQNTEYWPCITLEGYESVCARIRITDNPELANPKVFRKAIVKMVDKSETVIESPTENTVLMGYHRFGGELAMHILGVLFLELFKFIGTPEVDALYEMFDCADMDLDENRISPMLMQLTGIIIMGLFP